MQWEYVNTRPKRQSRCTDPHCCLALLAASAAFLLVAAYMHLRADLPRLFSPFDRAGQPCGIRPAQNHPFLLFSNGFADFYCVRQCPSNSSSPLDCYRQVCPAPQQTAQVARFCLPHLKQLSDLALPFFQRLIYDLDLEAWIIGVAVAVSFAEGLLALCVIGWLMKQIVWLMLEICMVFLAMIGAFCILLGTGNSTVQELVGWQDLPQAFREGQEAILGVGVALSFLCLILIVSVMCLKKRIQVAIKILSASAEFARQHLEAILIPLFTLLPLLATTALAGAAILWTLGAAQVREDTDYRYPFAQLQLGEVEGWTIAGVLFLCLWLNKMIAGAAEYSLAHMVARWYTQSYDMHLLKDLTASLGSLALGSFLASALLVVKWVTSLILQYQEAASKPLLSPTLLKMLGCHFDPPHR